MTDEEFLFRQDCTEKKRTAIGAHHKVTHGGRVMMPSDYLTKKEKEAMNSDVITFKLNKRALFTKELIAESNEFHRAEECGLIDSPYKEDNHG